MQKAGRALVSARPLLDAGDTDGACNRAYHAMFDAARAALADEVEPQTTKAHGGLIAAFGLHLVKSGRLPKQLGRMQNRAHEVRLLADYTGGLVEPGGRTRAALPGRGRRRRAEGLSGCVPRRSPDARERLVKKGSEPAVSPQIHSRLEAVCRLPNRFCKACVSPASGLLRAADTARRRSPLAGEPTENGSVVDVRGRPVHE